MKIALLITGLGMGGAERQVVDLADRFAASNHEVIIIYLTGKAIVQPTDHSIRVMGMGMQKTAWSFILIYFRLRSLLNSYKPDVLHSHMIHANIMARLLRLSTKIPRLICTAHNTNEGGRLRMLAYRTTDFLCDLSTNVSQEAVESFIAKKAAPKGRMIPMYNGVDTKKFIFNAYARKRLRAERKISDTDRLLLCVGRLMEQKDYPTMLRAFHTILQMHMNTFLWIVGTGELLPQLQQLAYDLEIHNHVTFLGQRNDIPDLMSAADIFCLSSSYEGFGLVVAEAMACERVVVATNCGGVKEVVGTIDFLIPPHNALLLASALHKIIDMDPRQAKRIGEESRKRIVENYSLESIVQKWLNLYTLKTATLRKW